MDRFGDVEPAVTTDSGAVIAVTADSGGEPVRFGAAELAVTADSGGEPVGFGAAELEVAADFVTEETNATTYVRTWIVTLVRENSGCMYATNEGR